MRCKEKVLTSVESLLFALDETIQLLNEYDKLYRTTHSTQLERVKLTAEYVKKLIHVDDNH